jgi:hypothetical protein
LKCVSEIGILVYKVSVWVLDGRSKRLSTRGSLVRRWFNLIDIKIDGTKFSVDDQIFCVKLC